MQGTGLGGGQSGSLPCSRAPALTCSCCCPLSASGWSPGGLLGPHWPAASSAARRQLPWALTGSHGFCRGPATLCSPPRAWGPRPRDHASRCHHTRATGPCVTGSTPFGLCAPSARPSMPLSCPSRTGVRRCQLHLALLLACLLPSPSEQHVGSWGLHAGASAPACPRGRATTGWHSCSRSLGHMKATELCTESVPGGRWQHGGASVPTWWP